MSLELGRLLKKLGRTIAVAESCTGGLLSKRLTDEPGSSAYFKGSVVCYSNEIKKSFLKVPEGILKKHGAVSAAVARILAQNIRGLFKTDYGVAITGIAGPGGASSAKPVGLVFLAVSSRRRTRVVKRFFLGTRGAIRQKTVKSAIELLFREIKFR